MPDKLLIEALVAARDRNVRVRILLPGPHVDALTIRIASKGKWVRLLQAGSGIHVYQPTVLLSKLLVVDKKLVSVVSTSFNSRSIRRNDEARLNIYNREFASQMAAVLEADRLAPQPYSQSAGRIGRCAKNALKKSVSHQITALIQTGNGVRGWFLTMIFPKKDAGP